MPAGLRSCHTPSVISHICAAAEAAGLVVLHYDHDFDLIADVTGQQTEWIVPGGTIP